MCVCVCVCVCVVNVVNVVDHTRTRTHAHTHTSTHPHPHARTANLAKEVLHRVPEHVGVLLADDVDVSQGHVLDLRLLLGEESDQGRGELVLLLNFVGRMWIFIFYFFYFVFLGLT